jgi:hypothetical protein
VNKKKYPDFIPIILYDAHVKFNPTFLAGRSIYSDECNLIKWFMAEF